MNWKQRKREKTRKTGNGPRLSHKESSVHLDNAARNLNRMRSTKCMSYSISWKVVVTYPTEYSDFECYAKSTNAAHYKRNTLTVLIDVGTIRVWWCT